MLYDVQWLDAGLFGLVGILIGSFLNVVVYRLPKMLEQQWQAEAADMAGLEPPEQEPFNLMVPRSRCPHCGHAIRWFENIPVLSFLALGGKCSACKICNADGCDIAFNGNPFVGFRVLVLVETHWDYDSVRGFSFDFCSIAIGCMVVAESKRATAELTLRTF